MEVCQHRQSAGLVVAMDRNDNPDPRHECYPFEGIVTLYMNVYITEHLNLSIALRAQR